MSSIDKAERLMLYVFALLSLPQKMRQREITSGEVLISDMALESYRVRIPDGLDICLGCSRDIWKVRTSMECILDIAVVPDKTMRRLPFSLVIVR